MKRAALKQLIDTLENKVDDEHFYMSEWLRNIPSHSPVIYDSEYDIPYCQTAGCIAGWVFLGLTPRERAEYRRSWKQGGISNFDFMVEAAAATELGLNRRQSRVLFAPNGLRSYTWIKREHAIKVLKNILETSQIDWGAAGLKPEALDLDRDDEEVDFQLPTTAVELTD